MPLPDSDEARQESLRQRTDASPSGPKSIVIDDVSTFELAEWLNGWIGAFQKYREEAKPSPPTKAYVRRKITEFEPVGRVSWTYQVSEREDWNWIIFDYVRQSVLPSSSFETLLNRVVRRFEDGIRQISPSSDPRAQCRYWLESLLGRLIAADVAGSLSTKEVLEQADLFRSELHLAPIEFHQLSFLHGIRLQEDVVFPEQGALIRQLRPEDLEREREIFDDAPDPLKEWLPPPTVLEIRRMAKDESPLSQAREMLLLAMRLFRPSSILLLETQTRKRSALWGSSGVQLSRSNRGRDYFRDLTIAPEETAHFVRSCTSIRSRLQEALEKGDDPVVKLAIDRYGESLHDSFGEERRLLNSVMGLEGIFSLDEDRGENAFKVSMRTAKMLSFVGFEGRSVRADVAMGYHFRNQIVHGKIIKPSLVVRLRELAPRIIDYLRGSLLLVLFLDIPRKQLVKHLDGALVDPANHQGLESAVREASEMHAFLPSLLSSGRESSS